MVVPSRVIFWLSGEVMILYSSFIRDLRARGNDVVHDMVWVRGDKPLVTR